MKGKARDPGGHHRGEELRFGAFTLSAVYTDRKSVRNLAQTFGDRNTIAEDNPTKTVETRMDTTKGQAAAPHLTALLTGWVWMSWRVWALHASHGAIR